MLVTKLMLDYHLKWFIDDVRSINIEKSKLPGNIQQMELKKKNSHISRFSAPFIDIKKEVQFSKTITKSNLNYSYLVSHAFWTLIKLHWLMHSWKDGWFFFDLMWCRMFLFHSVHQMVFRHLRRWYSQIQKGRHSQCIFLAPHDHRNSVKVGVCSLGKRICKKEIHVSLNWIQKTRTYCMSR